MSILVLEHHPLETSGVLGKTLRDHGQRLRVIHLDRGGQLPPDLDDVEGIVIMGGPQNVDETEKYPWLEGEMQLIRDAREKNLPMVGICLGAQLIAKALGGEVAPMASPQGGYGMVRLSMPKFVDPVMQGIRWQFPVFHLHGQEVTKLPPEGVPLCSDDTCKIQAYRVGLNIYCFQYHFEADAQMIDAFYGFDLMKQLGLDAQTIAAQKDAHAKEYTRLGQRLSENIAILLMPVDRQVAV